MDQEKSTPEMQAVITHLAEGFVREGLLVLPELSDEQIDKALPGLVNRFLFDDNLDSALTLDSHTDNLLTLAEFLEEQGELEHCCLFYMLWIEHRINLILRVLLRRKGTSDKDAIAIVRKLGIREKLTWLWKLLGLEPVEQDILADISAIEEFRNGFVHYKWQSSVNFENENRTWQAVDRVDEIIAKLIAIEETHVFYGQRSRLSESAARLNDS